MYGVYQILSIKKFRNSSWYQSQFFETLIPSGHLLFRQSFIPAKSLWPSLIPTISLSGHLSFRSSFRKSPCPQSQGRKCFLVGRIVVRKHSPSANFSGDNFFLHRKDRLEEISKFSQSTGARKPSTRRPRAFFRPAREPLSGDALPHPGSPDADQPPSCFCHLSPARASFGVLLPPRALRTVFPTSSDYFILNPNPCTCLGKCSSTFPVHDKIRNDIITSIQRHVTRIRGQI